MMKQNPEQRDMLGRKAPAKDKGKSKLRNLKPIKPMLKFTSENPAPKGFGGANPRKLLRLENPNFDKTSDAVDKGVRKAMGMQ